jgi:hypothetical protein
VNAGLGIAGVLCVALALGHETVGQVWVLPAFSKERLSGTRLGPSSMTEGMLRVTWHIVTIFALGVGGILLTLAWDGSADPRTLLLRWLAAMRHGDGSVGHSAPPPLFAAPAGALALGGHRGALLECIDVSGPHLAAK